MKRGQVIALRHEAAPAGTELSDVGLVAACAAGDRAARTLLFERHVDSIYRFISRMRGSDADVIDDLVQATFLRAFGAAQRFRGESARSWLFGIAANVVREHARSEIRRKRLLQIVAEEQPRASLPPDAYALSRLPGAISELPHDLRVALVLVDLEGERGSDAALALGVPEGTLWRRLFHARAALREALAGGDS